IVGLHCVTTANALHFGYQTAQSQVDRAFLLLQAASFLPMFRQAMIARGKIRDDVRIDTLEAVKPQATGAGAVEEILTDVSKDRIAAAQKTIAMLQSKPADAEPLMAAARRLIFLKGRDSHDYKFSSASLEDFYHASPVFRGRFLATSMFNL